MKDKKTETADTKENLYTTLGGEGFFEITIDRSVFYGYAKHVTEEKDAVDFINQIKKKTYQRNKESQYCKSGTGGIATVCGTYLSVFNCASAMNAHYSFVINFFSTF